MRKACPVSNPRPASLAPVLFLVAALGCRAAAPDPYDFLRQPGVGVESEDSLWARLPYDSIYLRRDPCFGTCPSYEAVFHRGGTARYRGIRFVEREGEYHGRITIQDYGRLAWLLDRFEFMAMPDSFKATYTDLPGAVLGAFRRDAGTRMVYDYGYVGPVELWTLREVFDAIAGQIVWTKAGP